MKKTLFIKNALILTVSSLILRFAGIIFKVWLAQRIGSEGIGLYQLVFSVYALASTFAISGTSTAVTRLVSEELALQNTKGALKILRRAIEISLIIAFFSLSVLFVGSDFISSTLLGDPRTASALKILPLGLPFVGVTSCLRGYFIARRRVTPNAVSQIFEQAVRIILIFVLVERFSKKGLSACCFAVILGDIAAEALACMFLFIPFAFDRKKLRANTDSFRKAPILKRILHISVPITLGRYLNTGLRTAENILVPKSLAKHPLSADSALSQFGMIKGMALPILFFPAALLNAISTLLIPEISEAVALKRSLVVKNACERILKITTLVGMLFGAIFWGVGKEIGYIIYKDFDVGVLLVALSPIVPLMYLDSICDGILKGLDQQAFTFKTSISDSAIRIVLIIFMLPRFSLWGFIIIMYFSNLLTCSLNVGRLIKISNAKINLLKTVLLPLAASLLSTSAMRLILLRLEFLNCFWYVVIFCLLSVALYFLILFSLGACADLKEIMLNSKKPRYCTIKKG